MRRPHTQRRLGLVLMTSALVGAMVAGPAFAQDGGEEAEEVETPVEAAALITYPANDAIPDTLLSQFPPQVVCVVFPEACPESLQPVREPIGGVLKEVDDNDQTSPLQPANPEGLTVTYTAGTPRYASAVQVQLPDVPEDEEVDQFVLSFPQGQPTFSFDSPLFRRVVLAVVATAGSQDPETFQEQMAKAQEEEPLSEPLLGIEACPLTVPIPEDAQAPQSVPVSEISEENADGEAEPAVNCLFGSNGQFDEDEQRWSFDLTFAAKAWADGTLDNHGILLRPTGAPNLAFGDPDTSTNAQVVLDLAEEPRALFASSKPAPPPEPLAPLPPPSNSGTGDSTGTADSSASTGSTSSSSPSSTPISSPPSAPSGGTATTDTPPAEVAPPETAPPSAGQQDVAMDAAGQEGPTTPWVVWLLVVPFAGGAWLTARSLGEDLVLTGATSNGALTRLTGGGVA